MRVFYKEIFVDNDVDAERVNVALRRLKEEIPTLDWTKEWFEAERHGYLPITGSKLD